MECIRPGLSLRAGKRDDNNGVNNKMFGVDR